MTHLLIILLTVAAIWIALDLNERRHHRGPRPGLEVDADQRRVADELRAAGQREPVGTRR